MRMNSAIQARHIQRILANAPKFDMDQFDVHAHIDSRLTLSENIRNIGKITGTNQRNRGMEEYQQNEVERERNRQRRNHERPYQSWRGIVQDMSIRAMRPGRRVSASGNRYYENRNNRVDRRGNL